MVKVLAISKAYLYFYLLIFAVLPKSAIHSFNRVSFIDGSGITALRIAVIMLQQIYDVSPLALQEICTKYVASFLPCCGVCNAALLTPLTTITLNLLCLFSHCRYILWLSVYDDARRKSLFSSAGVATGQQ
jgi:hypothetical protein